MWENCVPRERQAPDEMGEKTQNEEEKKDRVAKFSHLATRVLWMRIYI